MLYPDFKELITLARKASRAQFASRRQSVAAASGNYTSPFRGQGLEFHEVREYRAGDDIRSIDWRVTARTNKPYVKVFTEERERTVILCIDANSSMCFGTRGTFKSVQAARAAALLGWQANGCNDRVGSLVFGDVPQGLQYFMPTRSRQALWQTLKLLSRASQGVHKTPVTLESGLKDLERVAPKSALIFVIGDFHQVTESMENRLGNLHRTCDIVLVTVNDPADQGIPAMETVVFANDIGRRITFDTESRAGREAYARQWVKNRKRLEDIATRLGIGVVDLHTDKDVYAELLLGLRRLNIGRARR